LETGIPENRYQGLKALIVDDEFTFREVMGQVLETMGIETFYAVDGIEGLEKYIEVKPDMVFTDYSMPKKNGLELAAAIQEMDPTVPIIIITASMYYELDIQSYDVNLLTILKKPFEIEDVVYAAERAYRSISANSQNESKSSGTRR